MMLLLKLAAALLPVILLWLYIWKKDPEKEPTNELVKATMWGVFICIPVALVEAIIHSILLGADAEPTNLFQSTSMAFFVAAIPEEAAKLLALWIVLRKNPYFDEHFDGIVYAVCVGLGFAALENVAYVLGGDEWHAIAIVRSLLAVPGHYIDAVLMGYFYVMFYFVKRSKKNCILIFLAPMLAHGIYDTLAMSAAINPYIGVVCFFLLIAVCILMHREAFKRIKSLIARDKALFK